MAANRVRRTDSCGAQFYAAFLENRNWSISEFRNAAQTCELADEDKLVKVVYELHTFIHHLPTFHTRIENHTVPTRLETGKSARGQHKPTKRSVGILSTVEHRCGSSCRHCSILLTQNNFIFTRDGYQNPVPKQPRATLGTDKPSTLTVFLLVLSHGNVMVISPLNCRKRTALSLPFFSPSLSLFS